MIWRAEKRSLYRHFEVADLTEAVKLQLAMQGHVLDLRELRFDTAPSS